MVARGVGHRDRGIIVDGYRVSHLQDENILEICQHYRTVHFKMAKDGFKKGRRCSCSNSIAVCH